MTALAATDEVKAEAAHRQRLTRLHVSYGNALLQARGYGAPETTEAFARARESAASDKDALGRLASDYGLWVSSYVRGDLPSMREHAAGFLSDVEASPDSPEAGVAHRAAGMTCWSPASTRKRGITWKGRSPCSNPAVTMIWPFGSRMTPAPAQCLAWRLRHGLSARSIARFRSSTVCRCGSRASPTDRKSVV